MTSIASAGADSRYRLGPDTFDAASANLQQILAAAHQNKARPACRCCPPCPVRLGPDG